MPRAPKDNPQRRNARVGPRQLPAEGRKGRAPAWPLDEAHDAEKKVWNQLWRTPQAVAWERQGWTRTVARYARVLTAAEALDKDAMAEARQLEDRLGLTPKAMKLMLWEIVEDETADKRDQQEQLGGRRLRAVDAEA